LRLHRARGRCNSRVVVVVIALTGLPVKPRSAGDKLDRGVPHRPTLLVVDDEQNVLEVLTRMFDKSCDVITAHGATEALATLRTRRVDLMITDQRMPEMTGTELIAQARQEGI